MMHHMKTPIRTSILSALLVLAFALPAAALADKNESSRGDHRGGGKGHGVPEFDATAVGAIAAVIAGGGIVLARRRRS
jgi:hypothetical protein